MPKPPFSKTLVVLCSAMLSADPVFADEWHTGGVEIAWKDGEHCGVDQVCFRVYQPGRGIVGGTPNCWRQQIWRTRISGSPPGVGRYDLISESGRWRYGVQNVEFGNAGIIITTYLVQDHGGIGNLCRDQGFGQFILKFWVKSPANQ